MDFDKLKAMAESDLRQYDQLLASDDPADREKAEAIGGILGVLPERERVSLEWFYLKRYGYHTREMMDVLGVGTTSGVYLFKEKALQRYYTYMFAVMYADGVRSV